MKHIIIGVFTILAALWLGMYALHICPMWAELPTLLTMLGAMVVGVVLIVKEIEP